MNRRMQTFGALAGVLIALTGAANALATPHNSRVIALTNGQSDSNLRWARYRLDENIDMLQRDRHDYGGYRVRAISLFQQAREQLSLGLQYDKGREYQTAGPAVARPDADMVYLRGECASDVNLNVVRRNVEHITDVLQRDNADYGGHRAAALRLLAQGREMLRDAIAWDSTH